MHFSAVFTLLGAIASATAQNIFSRQVSYPACADTCLANPDYGGCISDDVHCLCTNQVFITNTTDCIYASCSGTDLQKALTTAQEVCETVGVTLTSTPSLTATSASASSTIKSVIKSSASSTSYSAILGLGATLAVAAMFI